MPRGRKKIVVSDVPVAERIAQVTAEIEETKAALAEKKKTLKEKNAELKALLKQQEAEAKVAAQKKIERDSFLIAEAVSKSGKTMEEVLEFLKG